MKKNMGILLGILFLTVSFILINFTNETVAVDLSSGPKTSMYVWDLLDIDNYTEFDKTINHLNVDTLYVGSYKDLTSYKNSLYFGYAKNNNLKTYLVYGEKESYETNDYTTILNQIKNLIDKIDTYNKTSNYKISGITIDSEFHSTDAYKTADEEGKMAMFRSYVDIMKEGYTYAHSKGLNYVVCIPPYYDEITANDDNDKILLEELIRDASDYIQLMNYNKGNMHYKIGDEITIASMYGKKVENLMEFSSNEEAIISYYTDGLEAGQAKLEELAGIYNYEHLSFNYHAYKYIKDLIPASLNTKNNTYYNFELTPKDINGANLKLDNLYLVHENEKIKGISFFDKTTNKNKVYFYGLIYGNSYNLLVDDGSYVTEVTEVNYTYIDTESNNKTDEKAFTKVEIEIPPVTPKPEPQPEPKPEPTKPKEEPKKEQVVTPVKKVVTNNVIINDLVVDTVIDVPETTEEELPYEPVVADPTLNTTEVTKSYSSTSPKKKTSKIGNNNSNKVIESIIIVTLLGVLVVALVKIFKSKAYLS